MIVMIGKLKKDCSMKDHIKISCGTSPYGMSRKHILNYSQKHHELPLRPGRHCDGPMAVVRRTMEHLDLEVRNAWIRLNDALCTWERATGRESVLVLREVEGFVSRSVSGKPVPCDQADLTDDQLFSLVTE